MTRHIPNLLTCCNLLCGVIGIFYIFEPDGWLTSHDGNGHLGIQAAWFVWAACIFDFLDGFVARALKVSSPIGKELDSLADVISFGLLPSVFMYKLIEAQSALRFLPLIALLIVVFSALRLAKFNIDDTQTDSFKGLPTPANALFITGLSFLDFPWATFLFKPVTLSVIAIVSSLILVSRIDLFALKFKDFSWQSNKTRFTFLFLSVLLLALFNFAAIPLIILLYIILSLGVVMLAR